MKNTRSAIVFLLSILCLNVFSQQVKVSTSLDKNAIMIGEQFHMKMKVEQPTKFKVVWPELSDTISKNIEIVEIGKTDTIFSGDKSNVTYNRDYLLTSFDSGAYTIPAFPFITPAGEIYTNTLFIKVDKPEVDTTKGIKDIKGPLEIPFDWKEYIPHVGIGFGVVILIVLIVYFIRRYLRKKRIARENKPAYVPPPIPADEKALAALKELNEKQLWQRAKYKEYYTELTDILRDYIKDIYGINAPEMLTDEILQQLKYKDIDSGHKQALKTVLELADMVKFAKLTPRDSDSAEAIIVATNFVMDTTAAIKKAKEKNDKNKNKKDETKGGENAL